MTSKILIGGVLLSPSATLIENEWFCGDRLDSSEVVQ